MSGWKGVYSIHFSLLFYSSDFSTQKASYPVSNLTLKKDYNRTPVFFAFSCPYILRAKNDNAACYY